MPPNADSMSASLIIFTQSPLSLFFLTRKKKKNKSEPISSLIYVFSFFLPSSVACHEAEVHNHETITRVFIVQPSL